MLNKRFFVDSFNGKTPRDGSPLMLDCHKDKGLTLYVLRGFKKEQVDRYDPESSELHKVGAGNASRWTGNHKGDWDVDVWHDEGLTSFNMKGKGDALMLINWIKKYAKRKAHLKTSIAGASAALPEQEAMLAVPEVDAEAARRDEYLKGLCQRLNNVRGRATLEEVDRDIKAIVADIEREMNGISRN